jgi:hypothetical protein
MHCGRLGGSDPRACVLWSLECASVQSFVVDIRMPKETLSHRMRDLGHCGQRLGGTVIPSPSPARRSRSVDTTDGRSRPVNFAGAGYALRHSSGHPLTERGHRNQGYCCADLQLAMTSTPSWRVIWLGRVNRKRRSMGGPRSHTAGNPGRV